MKNRTQAWKLVPIAAAMLAVLAPVGARAGDTSWVGAVDTAGDWSFGENWSNGGPAPGDNAFVEVSGATATFDVTLDPSLNLLTIDGGATVAQGANTLTSDTLILGTSGVGTYDLGGGTLNVGTASFDVDPGTGSLIVGDTGQGVVNMTGGTLNILNDDIATAAFVVGNQSESLGTFTQSGGAVNGGRSLAIGLNGGTGTYNLNTDTVNATNPTLSTGFIALGNNSGAGTFNQQAGTTNTTDSLYIGNQGTYNLDGGSLVTTGTGIGQGTIVGTAGSDAQFSHSAGTHTANNLVVGNQSDGTGTYDLSGGEVTVNGRMYVGLGQNAFSPGLVNGWFQQSGGTVTASQIYVGGFPDVLPDVVNHTGTGRYDLSEGEVNSTVTEIGRSGNGQALQTGGVFNAGALQLGSDGFSAIDNGSGGFDFYSSGSYDLQGGQLNTTSTTVSVAGLGTFKQSGTSEHTVSGNLVVGSFRTAVEPVSLQRNQGIYNLSGGTLTVEGSSIVGAGNNDHVNFPGASGGTGTFTQTGGEHLVTDDLIVGQEGTQGGGTGSYSITAGTLDVSGTLRLSQNNPGAVGGTATFTQGGGVVSVSGLDQQGANGASSVYTLNAGTLTSGGGSMTDASVFNQAGGTYNGGGFNIGNGGGSDYDTVYNLTGAGAVANFTDLVVGGFGIGILNQSAGTLNVTDVARGMRVGDGPNLNPERRYGKYDLSGGIIENAGSLIVGSGNGVDADPGFPGEPGGLGSFLQSGGAHAIGANLILGQSGNVGGGYRHLYPERGQSSCHGQHLDRRQWPARWAG